MTVAPLYLLHCQPDPRLLAAWAAQRRLLVGSDLGYPLHALLHAVFGDAAPQPFAYDDPEQGLLAYTRMAPEDIEQAVALADPAAADALGLSAGPQSAGYRLRAFPTQWQSGQVIGFTLRVRPIEREAKTGHERDAFIGAVLNAAPTQTLVREAVYASWLAAQLAARPREQPQPWQGGAELLEARLTRFALSPVLRRTQRSGANAERTNRTPTGPDATLSGHLRVLDPAAFAALLTRGVGRHRAFGFGMLRLLPASLTV
jgi:CRISPR system Cascade subunit CasE